GTTCAASYDSSTVVTLTATPTGISIFLGWSGCDTVSGTICIVTMNAARSVDATFLGVPLLLSVPGAAGQWAAAPSVIPPRTTVALAVKNVTTLGPARRDRMVQRPLA